MVHGRMIRPAVAGAVPVKVDESSIKDIPGAQVVHQNGFLGVVAPKEWDAIQAMQKLKVEWSKVEPPFPNQNALYDHIRKAPVRKRAVEGKTVGNVDEAFKTAAKVIEAEYEWPFQSHAAMGPACARGRDQGRQGQLLERHAEVALRADRPRRAARRAAGERARELDDRSGLLRPQRRRRLRGGLRGAGQGGRQAGAPAIHARPGHRLGPEGPGLDPHARARRSTPRATSSPTSSSARASRGSTSTPTAASCSTRWPARRSASR